MQFILGMKVHKIAQKYVNLWNNLDFSLYATPSVYYIVATSYKRMKSKMEVSIDWYVTVEHWRSSSIRIIFVNYQINELQYNY